MCRGQFVNSYDHRSAVYSVSAHPSTPEVVITASENGSVYIIDTRLPNTAGLSISFPLLLPSLSLSPSLPPFPLLPHLSPSLPLLPHLSPSLPLLPHLSPSLTSPPSPLSFPPPTHTPSLSDLSLQWSC